MFNPRLGASRNDIQHQILLWGSKVHISRIRCTQQFPDPELDLYVKRFHERALDCYTVDEEIMVDICLHRMANEYHVYFLESFISLFFKLMEATRRANESVRRPPCPHIVNRSGTMLRLFSRKRLVVLTAEDNQETSPSKPKNPSFRQSYNPIIDK